MEIVFRTFLHGIYDSDYDNYSEEYEASIYTNQDGNSLEVSISACEADTSYEDFKADIFETILEGLLESRGEPLMVFEEEPTNFDDLDYDIVFDDDLFDEDSGYQIIYTDVSDEDGEDAGK